MLPPHRLERLGEGGLLAGEALDLPDDSRAVLPQQVLQRAGPDASWSLWIVRCPLKIADERNCVRPAPSDHVVDVIARTSRGRWRSHQS